MGGLVRERLVMVQAKEAGPGGGTHVGTGYLVGADLVLTASHVVPEDLVASIKVRVEKPGSWHAVSPLPVWRDDTLDALLLRLVERLPDIADVDWVETEFEADVAWHSSAYPDAGMIDLADGKSA